MRKYKLAILIGISPLPVIVALLAIHFLPGWLKAESQNAAAHLDARHSTIKTDAPGHSIASLTVSPATLSGGARSSVQLALRRPAPAGGLRLDISSSNPTLARPPKNLLIPAGQTKAAFNVETERVSSYSTVNLSLSFEGRNLWTDALVLMPAPRAEWYAAPDGRPGGRGTKDSPWDLQTALAGGASGNEVKPGDTLWLGGGRYAGAYTSTLAGKADAPILVRAHRGERAVLDRAGVGESKQPALKVRGSHVWFQGFEIMNSEPNRSRLSPYSGKDEPWRGSGADVYASDVKFVNMVFHDNGHGIWDKEDRTEVHGCLFFYNGNNKREHALYVGNSKGTKLITDNVVFAQGGYGILAHSNSDSSSQSGLHLEGNAVFNNGLLTLDDQTTGNLQVGGVEGVSAERVVLRNNYVYNSPNAARSKSNGIRLGYEETANRDVRLLDNYIVADTPLRLWWWQTVELKGNTIYSRGETLELKLPPKGAHSYDWDFNTYINASRAAAPTLVRDSDTFDFMRWQRATGFDAASRMQQSPSARPEGVELFIRPNRYEAGRAHLVVYNWALSEQVPVDLSSILSVGASYEIRDAQNYFGEPVAKGIYQGSPVTLPLKLLQVAPPVGKVERAPSHTAPEFAVFILQQTSSPARTNRR
ncbi:MAG TPA: hypothetical protein VGB73_13740 [Pyrinomonadaceae bacterium]|jgi:hypothetical protein